MLAEVVKIDPEHDRRLNRLGDRFDHSHQFGLAVVTAITIVQPVGGAFHLERLDRGPRKTPFSGQRCTIGALIASQGRRHRGHGPSMIGTQFTMSYGGKERRVGPTAECDDYRPELT